MFTPYPDHPGVLMARVAARSTAFAGTSAAGGAPVIVGSAAGHDRGQVTTGARGELLERLGNVMAGREAESASEAVGTLGELRARGLPTLDPAPALPGPGAGPGAEVRPDARRLWVRGRTVQGSEVFVPAGAAFLHHRPPPGCDPVPSAGSTGVAAHPDLARAARHAAWEVLERDLVRRSWYGLADRGPQLIADAELPPPLAALVRDEELAATAFAVPAPAGTACAVVCLHRPDGTGQAFGARCGPADTVPALVEKAAYEALMVRWSMGTRVARTTWDQWRGSGPPATAVQHALWAHHVQDSLTLWDVRPPAPETPAGAGDGRRRGAVPVRTDPLRVLAEHTGRDVVLVETTAAAVREAGVRVVRVLAPGALPLPPAAAPGHPHPFG
ncbi:YcaO-like family protein [Streptomyces sp. NPDC051567]|uniref:YcaO-like family protein n=1 Tax=Streptomyces sp. NPDC051567 TaxID=3365660 RepID=UPI0037BAEEDC